MVWLAPSCLEHKAAIQEGVINFMRHLISLERAGTVQNTIPCAMRRPHSEANHDVSTSHSYTAYIKHSVVLRLQKTCTFHKL